MIVADTNLIVHLLLPGERTSSAQSLLRKDSDWYAPKLWRSEFCNVLTVFLRKSILDKHIIQGRMREALAFMQGREFETDYVRVIELANGSKCSAYDCEFVALAQELGCFLVTSDRQLQAQFPHTVFSPLQYLET